MKKHAIFALGVLGFFAATVAPAFASTATASAPWDSGLMNFIGSIQNDVKLLSGFGIIIAGGFAIFGGHGELFKRMGGIIAAICVVTFGATYIPGLWGVAL
uniref:Conjugal transfer protein TrbC n=1 Tax=Leptospirillum ferrodiazotrophum TaxID=412449 RepID=C6HTX7_9BACT|nr:MAG: hypothetical protein UBAL3_44810042 [Leptospirillum ferrodiazotrophum]